MFRRAPPSILNVLPGQPVELRVAKRTTDDYVAPKRGAFHGSGNRLGAPVPDIASSSASASGSTSMPGSFTPEAPPPAASDSQPDRAMGAPKFEVDQSKPTTSVQIRLADGTRSVLLSYVTYTLPHTTPSLFIRMVARMNHTHTVLDLRNFINASVSPIFSPYTIVSH